MSRKIPDIWKLSNKFQNHWFEEIRREIRKYFHLSNNREIGLWNATKAVFEAIV